MKTKRKPKPRSRDAVVVRVPEPQRPFIYVPGSGWHISVLWNYGADVEVTWPAMRELLMASKGDVVIARRLVGSELKFFEQYRDDIDHEVHARLIFKDPMRWQRGRGKRSR